MHLELNSFVTKLYPNLRDYMVLAIRFLLWSTTHKVMRYTQRMLFWHTRWIWTQVELNQLCVMDGLYAMVNASPSLWFFLQIIQQLQGSQKE